MGCVSVCPYILSIKVIFTKKKRPHLCFLFYKLLVLNYFCTLIATLHAPLSIFLFFSSLLKEILKMRSFLPLTEHRKVVC